MAHRSGAVALLVVVALLPTTAGAVPGQQSDPATVADESPPLAGWLDSPVRYLITEKETIIGEGITDAAEFAAFRRWFWQRRDPFPETAVNEFREVFDERVDYANKEFGNPLDGIAGWRTPPGVVYIMLGLPTRISRSVTHVAGTAGGTLVNTWVYELPGASLLEVPFVQVDDVVNILTTATNRALQVRLDQALRRAAQESVFDPDLPFSALANSVGRPGAAAWPARAAVRRDAGGIDAELAIRLTELFGRPDGDGLRVNLRFTTAPVTGAPPIDLGTLSVLLARDDFERWADRELTLALWLPPREELAACAGIDVVETSSGRGIRLAPTGVSDVVAGSYDLEELVAYTRLWKGAATVLAFVRTVEGGPNHPMHVLRRLPGPEGFSLDDPSPGFLFVVAGPR